MRNRIAPKIVPRTAKTVRSLVEVGKPSLHYSIIDPIRFGGGLLW